MTPPKVKAMFERVAQRLAFDCASSAQHELSCLDSDLRAAGYDPKMFGVRPVKIRGRYSWQWEGVPE